MEQPADLRVEHAFLLTLAHRRLRPREMFQVSRSLDFHEVGGGPLVVDVEKVAPTATTLRLTPRRPVTYAEMEAEVARLLERLAESPFGAEPTVEALDWLVPDPGIPSEDRATMGRIR